MMLTHHPPKWLDAASHQYLFGEIASHGRFAVHVCGHLHDANSLEIREAGTETRRLWQGRSLFGLETYGQEQQRLHSYTVGSLDIGTTTGSLRFWPREARLHGNQRNIVPDYSIGLNDDQHTEPSTFKLLRPYER